MRWFKELWDKWIGWILALLVVWAMCFGVTVNGKHYGVAGCDEHGGVKIDQ